MSHDVYANGVLIGRASDFAMELMRLEATPSAVSSRVLIIASPSAVCQPWPDELCAVPDPPPRLWVKGGIPGRTKHKKGKR